MASATSRLILFFRTNKMAIAKTAVLIAAAVIDPKGTVVAAIRTAIAGIQKCTGKRATIVKKAVKSNTAADADYEDVEDKILIEFTDTNNGKHYMKIPCPKASLFEDDKETGKIDEAPLATFIANVAGCAVTAEGSNFLAECTVARRIRRKRTQKR